MGDYMLYVFLNDGQNKWFYCEIGNSNELYFYAKQLLKFHLDIFY